MISNSIFKRRILITGGSGFIGTNLMELFVSSGFNVINLDIEPPRDKRQMHLWKRIDICDPEALTAKFLEFNPTHVVHLAARTDLNEQRDIGGYKANMQGVANLINAANNCPSVERVMIASSMLVCAVGYDPVSYDDYNPTTLYGKSKVETERIVKSNKDLQFEWIIVRPTSIWGPWFGEPYRNFFDFVLSRKFFKIKGNTGRKTFGYVENTTAQIMNILFANKELVSSRTFYLGDSSDYIINDWGDEIASAAGIKIGFIPLWILKLLARLGDALKVIKMPFPMSSFRLKNMTSSNVVSLLKDTHDIMPILPVSRNEGIKSTLAWMRDKKCE